MIGLDLQSGKVLLLRFDCAHKEVLDLTLLCSLHQMVSYPSAVWLGLEEYTGVLAEVNSFVALEHIDLWTDVV